MTLPINVLGSIIVNGTQYDDDDITLFAHTSEHDLHKMGYYKPERGEISPPNTWQYGGDQSFEESNFWVEVGCSGRAFDGKNALKEMLDYLDEVAQ
jgi:hypothetical protein